MSPKNIHKIFIPPKIFIFLKTPKNTKIQNFEPKNGPSLRIRVPPPPLGVSPQPYGLWRLSLIRLYTSYNAVQIQYNTDTLLFCFVVLSFFLYILQHPLLKFTCRLIKGVASVTCIQWAVQSMEI